MVDYLIGTYHANLGNIEECIQSVYSLNFWTSSTHHTNMNFVLRYTLCIT